jgi:hypothetical protein
MQAQAQDRPRFRQDLVAEPVEDGGTRFIDVMDPDSGSVYRFFEVEYSLACAMDGERDVPHIIQWSKDELGLAPSPAEVRNVIATLGELGFIDRTGDKAGAKPGPGDDMLRPGVVVGEKRPHAPVVDFELGNAGATANAPAAKPLPTSNIELAPGVTAGRPQPAAKQSHDIALGQPGRSDVSTDLADQMNVGLDDVKAAVRASQVMKAVDVPPELAAELESPANAGRAASPEAMRSAIEPPKPKEIPRARNTPPPMPVVKPPPNIEVAKPVEAPKPAPVAAKPVEAPKPTVKPAAIDAHGPTAPIAKVPDAKTATAKAPPAPAPGTSKTLVVVLVIVAIAAIAFLAYRRFVSSDTASNEPVKPMPVKPAPPAPPPVESEKMATSPEVTNDVKPQGSGTIETLVPDGAVKAGAVIATLAGSKPIQTEVAALQKDVDKRLPADIDQAQKDIDAANAANNKAQLATAQAKLAERQKALADKKAKLDARQADLDKLEIKAPNDGTIKATAKVGAKVTPTDAVFSLTQPAVRTVTFKKADGASTGTRVVLVGKADSKHTSCVTTSADPNAIMIQCPADAIGEGAEVTYGGIDPSPVPPPATDDTGSAGSAGSAAPAATPPAPKATPPRPAPRPQPKAQPKPAPGSDDSNATPATVPSGDTPVPAGSAQ